MYKHADYVDSKGGEVCKCRMSRQMVHSCTQYQNTDKKLNKDHLAEHIVDHFGKSINIYILCIYYELYIALQSHKYKVVMIYICSILINILEIILEKLSKK